MNKYLSFDEFKNRYEKTTKMNGLGRIANDDDLMKMFMAIAVIKQYDREYNKLTDKDDVNEREGDYARGN